MRWFLALLMFTFAGPAVAEPRDVPVGDPLRQVLLDSIRPEAETVLGSPVSFRVIELSVDGERAFARLYGVRPNGEDIVFEDTPAAREFGWSPDLFDGPRFEVFYHFDSAAWRVVSWEVGATDAWWFGYDCENFGQFFEPQAC